MFENNIVQRRLLKRKAWMDELEKAKADGNEWKARQLENKIFEFNKKHYPNQLWNSKEKGSYKKPIENKENQ